MERILEVVEADISGKLFELTIIEDCFSNGCESEADQKDISVVGGLDEDFSASHSLKLGGFVKSSWMANNRPSSSSASQGGAPARLGIREVLGHCQEVAGRGLAIPRLPPSIQKAKSVL